MVESIDVAAPVVAAVAVFALYAVVGRSNLGAEADWWERVRRSVLPELNRLARRKGLGYAAYEVGWDEFAGRADLDPEAVELVLEGLGFERMPLAAFKHDPVGRPEVGSWALRDGLLARRQLHVMLFETDIGTTDLFAHDEYNAFNPLYAAQHYAGVDYDPEAGVEQTCALFAERTSHALTARNVSPDAG